MNLGNLKASFSRRNSGRRHNRAPLNSDSSSPIATANGVSAYNNKEEIDAQRSVLLQSSKNKTKSDKNGLWKTLRLKFGGNRQCWEGNESSSPTQSDDEPAFTPKSARSKKSSKSKCGSVCPIPSPVYSTNNSERGLELTLKTEAESGNSKKWTMGETSISCSNNYDFEDDYQSVVASNIEIHSLTRELFKLSKYGWYWGPITRTEAEEKLSDQPDGAFLVRDSSDDRHLLSLSFRSYGKTLHTRIEHFNGLFSFYAQPEPEGHASIVDLIDDSMSYSQSGVFCYSRARSPGSLSFPVRLTKPVSRFTQVRTLQYLCRFVIRQYTRFDHIQKLPLPSRIRGYIEEGHY